jgi:hypothetical protein
MPIGHKTVILLPLEFHMKPFASVFHTMYNYKLISYSSSKSALRFGNKEFDLTPDELEDVQYAHSMDDISTPLRIVWTKNARGY